MSTERERDSSAVEMSTGRGSSAREGTARAIVADQIAQSIQSTSNLLLLMQQSSSSQARLSKLPKNLLDKTDTIRKTGQVLDRLPTVISSLDAHLENGLHSAPRLKTVLQLLANMESCQLNSQSEAHSDSASKNATHEAE